MFLALPALGGCGSKISEANYYRVHYGMSEKEVEYLLGPAHAESTESSATTAPAARKVKTWTRGHLTLHITFADGKVVARGADGIPREGLTPATGPHPDAEAAQNFALGASGRMG